MKILLLLMLVFLIGSISSSCEDIYYFLLDNQWDYNETDLEEYNITQTEIDKYYDNCSEPLPNKPQQEESKIIVIEREICDLSPNYKLFDYSFQFFDIHIGETSCDTNNVLKYFGKIEKSESYTITRIRIFPISLIIVLFFVLQIFRSNSYLNHLIEKIQKKNLNTLEDS